MNNTQARKGSCPPLPEDKQSKPYEPLHGEPGHDGNKPQFVTRREYPWVEGKREPSDSNFNVNHSRVCFLFTNKRIEQRQFLAAERLYKDYQKSCVDIRASSVLVGNGAGGMGSGPQDDKIDADDRYQKAMKALGRGADVIALVVIGNLTVEKASANLHMHRQKAWGRFDLALHYLADHYGL